MYVSFQVLSIINDYWLIHRIPVSLSGASTYNKLSRIMILCCCTHNSLVQCNHSNMIPEYDALYYLKKQWYYEFLPFLSNQPGIDKLILWDVTCIVPLFRDLRLLKITDIFDVQCMKFWYKFSNNTLPNYFRSMFQYNSSLYETETRNHDRMHVFPTRTFGACNVLRHRLPELVYQFGLIW